MATNMRVNHSTMSLDDYLDQFAGRETLEGYDATKPTKIAEYQRDFVWSIQMCMLFIASILGGYPIPLIVICNDEIMDGGNRSTALMLFRQGRFPVRIGEWEGTYADLQANPLLWGRWSRCQIPITRVTGATHDEKATIYENYNRGVTLKLGQLLEARVYKPLVDMAMALIGRSRTTVFPFAELIHRVWQRTWSVTTTRREIAFAFQILAASVFGPAHFHTSFSKHFRLIMNTTSAEINLGKLRTICEVIASADPEERVAARRKKMCFEKFVGAMIHDIHQPDYDIEAFRSKWRRFFEQAYNILETSQITEIAERIGTARADNEKRIMAISENVRDHLANIPIENDYETETEEDDEI